MNLQVLDKVCFTICIVCVVLGTGLSFSMIWVTYESDFAWKSWSTIAVLFGATGLTWIITKAFIGRARVEA